MSRVVIEEGYLKTVLVKLEEVRKSVDDLIDTLEILSDPGFQRELRESIKEAERGETEEFGSLNDLRKEISGE